MSDRRRIDFLTRLAGRKAILFGAGPTGVDLVSRIPIAFAYALDNDSSLWGTRVAGIEVRDPSAIAREAPGSFVVVIAVSAHEEVAEQLQSLGVHEDDVALNPLILSDVHDEAEWKNLLVTAVGKNGGVIRIDTRSGEQEQVLAADARGVAQTEEGFLIALEHEGFALLDSDLKIVRDVKADADLNLHGIAVDAERRVVYAAETAHDRVGVYDLDSFAKLEQFELGLAPSPADLHHVNDVALHDGDLYVSMFSRNGVWRNEVWNDGIVGVIDPASGTLRRVALSGLRQPHTITFDGDHLIVCNSMDLQVMRGDSVLCQLQGYPRGLALCGRLVYIGQSEIRRLSRIAANHSNLSRDSGVHIWNSDDCTSRFLKVPVTGIFELHVLGDD